MDNRIAELAAELGKAIKEDERVKALNEAKKVYDEDKDLMRYVIEYNVQQKAMANEFEKGDDRDEVILKQIQNRIDELYDLIVSNEAFVAMNAAQEVVNNFMNEVNGIITLNITGEIPCTHDCSTCHSDCASKK
ncbi:MAG: YlbF family regulator [Clostridia bacterium]|nr:YlbF family regulator [Clostridia bacterium]MBQ2378314.1 YlbF family regulator [Clostridia bacterium]